jgi:hypothetical protein
MTALANLPHDTVRALVLFVDASSILVYVMISLLGEARCTSQHISKRTDP